MKDSSNLCHERRIHGSGWAKAHGNYFSDPTIAEPYLAEIGRMIELTSANVVVDIGGGTGFILGALCERHPGIRLVNVDSSDVQLLECDHCQIDTVHMSALEIARKDIASGDDRALLINRSLLHYFGECGQSTFQRQMRSLLLPGEGMVQQAACFESVGVKECMNDLYAMMRTGKWYPTTIGHIETLEFSGWNVVKAIPGPALDLRSEDLAHRYILDDADVRSMCERICMAPPDVRDFYMMETNGFRSTLPYQIAFCLAR